MKHGAPSARGLTDRSRARRSTPREIPQPIACELKSSRSPAVPARGRRNLNRSGPQWLVA